MGISRKLSKVPNNKYESEEGLQAMAVVTTQKQPWSLAMESFFILNFYCSMGSHRVSGLMEKFCHMFQKHIIPMLHK